MQVAEDPQEQIIQVPQEKFVDDTQVKIEDDIKGKIKEDSEVKEFLERLEKPESSQIEDCVGMIESDDEDDDDSGVTEDILGMLEFDDGSREQNEAVKHLELELQNWKPTHAQWIENKG